MLSPGRKLESRYQILNFRLLVKEKCYFPLRMMSASLTLKAFLVLLQGRACKVGSIVLLSAESQKLAAVKHNDLNPISSSGLGY